MDYLSAGAETLRVAEASLKDLVAKAASGGDYASVVQIAAWAQAVKDIASAKSTAHDKRTDVAIANGSRRVVAQAKVSKRSGQKELATEYPKFYRCGDQLVRVAWSKRDKSEYQHKTTRSVLKKLADTLCSAGKEGRVFSTDDILPVQDEDGRAVPMYQAYVCIALLKQTGLIDQHGRQGYSLTRAEDFTKSIDSIWKTIPDKLPRRPR